MTYLRVAQRTVTLTPNTDGYYDVDLKLTNKGLSPAGTGEGSTGAFPYRPSTPSIVQQIGGSGSLTMPEGAPADGDTLVYAAAARGGFTTDPAAFGYTLGPDGLQDFGGYKLGWWYKLASGDTDSLAIVDTHLSGVWFELPGEWAPDTHATNSSTSGGVFTAGPITVAAQSIAFAVGAGGVGGGYDAVACTRAFTPGTGWTEDLDICTPSGGGPNVWVGHQFPSAGSITGQTTTTPTLGSPGDIGAWGMQVVSFTSVDGAFELPPAPGQYVNYEAATPSPDGVTTTFSTRWPFANGSLRVVFNGIGVSTSSEDGAAGSFTLPWAPPTGGEVWTTYQGR